MDLFQANISALEMADNQIRMFHVSFCDVGISKSFLPRHKRIYHHLEARQTRQHPICRVCIFEIVGQYTSI